MYTYIWEEYVNEGAQGNDKELNPGWSQVVGGGDPKSQPLGISTHILSAGRDQFSTYTRPLAMGT